MSEYRWDAEPIGEIIEVGFIETPDWLEIAAGEDRPDDYNRYSRLEKEFGPRLTYYLLDLAIVRQAVFARRAGQSESADGYRILVKYPNGKSQHWKFNQHVGYPWIEEEGRAWGRAEVQATWGAKF